MPFSGGDRQEEWFDFMSDRDERVRVVGIIITQVIITSFPVTTEQALLS